MTLRCISCFLNALCHIAMRFVLSRDALRCRLYCNIVIYKAVYLSLHWVFFCVAIVNQTLLQARESGLEWRTRHTPACTAVANGYQRYYTISSWTSPSVQQSSVVKITY